MKKIYSSLVVMMLMVKNIKIIMKCFYENRIEKIRLFNFFDWHFKCAYFSGKIGNNTVFIKIDLNGDMLCNEKIFYDMFLDKIDLVPLISFFDGGENLKILVLDFIDGKVLEKTDIIENPQLLGSIFNIIKTINCTGVIHRDIKLDNFIISFNRVYIIDFVYCCKIGSHFEEDIFNHLESNKKNYQALKSLGVGVKLGDFIWNDFYSMVTIISCLENEEVSNNKKVQFERYRNMFSKYAYNDRFTYTLEPNEGL